MEVIVVFGVVAGLIIGVALYFVPTIVAAKRENKSTVAIFFVNLLFGWSGLGWLLALLWACVGETHLLDAKGQILVLPPGSEASKICPQCAEAVKAGALKCRFCGFDFTPVAITVEAAEKQEPLESQPRAKGSRFEEFIDPYKTKAG